MCSHVSTHCGQLGLIHHFLHAQPTPVDICHLTKFLMPFITLSDLICHLFFYHSVCYSCLSALLNLMLSSLFCMLSSPLCVLCFVIFTDILAGFTFNNRVLRLPAIVLLTRRNVVSIKRLLEDEELCCCMFCHAWITGRVSLCIVLSRILEYLFCLISLFTVSKHLSFT